MDLLDATRHAHQFGQLLAVHVVVAGQDMVDELIVAGGLPVAFVALALGQRLESIHQRLGGQADALGSLTQADAAAAAEVDIVVTEDPGGAGQGQGGTADALFDQIHESGSWGRWVTAEWYSL